MIQFLEFTFSSFWKFAGVCLLLSGFGNVAILIISRIVRSSTIKKHGYPPPHCDADGDFKKEKDGSIN